MTAWSDFWESVNVVQLGAWVLGIVAFLAVAKKGYPVLRGLVRLIDALQVLPAFMEKTTDTLAAQNEKIQEIHHEVNYNNGSSVKDAIERLEKAAGTKPAKRTTKKEPQ